eukprot:GHVT01075381.1.p1 GENE.GHVT01075381.1~~GHVT01075381.1.p1  ORF type:complete len:201 (-),score=4.60 GHVT01075381.1:785-1387(-)
MQGHSICAFCARMKRGILYNCMRQNKYTVLVLGQHLDDICESFVMSAFHNGVLNTMKAHYVIGDGELRVCRPLIYTREKTTAAFARQNQLPVIQDNCPACFAAPKQRHRIKMLLSQQEFEIPFLFRNLLKTLRPLLSLRGTDKSLKDLLCEIPETPSAFGQTVPIAIRGGSAYDNVPNLSTSEAEDQNIEIMLSPCGLKS